MEKRRCVLANWQKDKINDNLSQNRIFTREEVVAFVKKSCKTRSCIAVNAFELIDCGTFSVNFCQL